MRHINYENSLHALKTSGLKEYYGKSNALTFEDKRSSFIYDLYVEGKTEEEILSIINQKNTYENN